MQPVADYHIHTPLCGHALGEPFEYAEQAVRIGLREIGFSDHAPFIKHPLPGITMTTSELPLYHRMIERVRGEYTGRLTVKIGLEVDFVPGYEDKTSGMLSQYPYDYIYGSVHFINEWAFDSPDERAKWGSSDINAVYREYYQLLQAAASSRLFDIMAHVDLVKKFGHRANVSMDGEIRETARIFKESNACIEINTSGLRKEAGEIYPALQALTIYAEEGVQIVFGSDAHLVQDVGKDFNLARDLAIKAGYREYVTLKDRKIDQVLPLL
ncbi:MAG: histidinol-phosphatase HisJ [Candidatus Omnitrophota bacterium]